MKKINRKYSFPVLSVVAICSFFIFTGGVLDQNSTLDTPPTITFEAESSNNYQVGKRQMILVKLSNYDPSQHEVTESCDLMPNVPDKNTTKYDKPESFMWIISPAGTDSVKLPYYFADNSLNVANLTGVYVDQYNQGSEQLMSVDYAFNTPGKWKLVCRARTVSHPAEKYVNGKKTSGGEPIYGTWVENSYTITIGGTALLSQQKYIFKSLEIIPSVGDPAPAKTFTLSDPTRQYLDIISPTKASLKFYWTPDAADVKVYPNLASKYDFDYQNAQYSIQELGRTVEGYPYTYNLYYKGQILGFYYSNTEKKIAFTKHSKMFPYLVDQFILTLQ